MQRTMTLYVTLDELIDVDGPADLELIAEERLFTTGQLQHGEYMEDVRYEVAGVVNDKQTVILTVVANVRQETDD